MSIIDAALSRSRTVIALLFFILIAGGIAYQTIPKEADPDINIPIIYVNLHHEGISPEDAERLLVRPVEKEVRSIEGIKELRSTAYEGGANVLMEFEAGFDADAALDDVREKVDLAKPELPDDSDEPTVHEVNLSLFPVLVVTMAGDLPERTMLRLARDLQDEVEALPQVLEAPIAGERKESVEIIIDPMKVESYNLRPDRIFDAIGKSNVLVAAGAMDTGQGRFSIKVPGLFEGLPDILSMPLVTEGDAVVTVGDVATVRKTFKDPETYARVDGRKAFALEVSKRTGENIIDTIEQVKAVVAEVSTEWPENVEIGFSQDKSSDIRVMLADLQNNVTSAILLVMIVIVAALGLRGGLLVGIAIPGSFLAGILVLSTAGLTVNIVVLFSLILAVGMLVDGAIVVIEYADRKLAEGEPKEVAYGLAAKRMAWPIIASTATTLAAFMPLLFWPGVVGEFMKFMPITLIATLSASLAMALLFIPVLGANLTTVVTLILTLAITGGFSALGAGLASSFIGPDMGAIGAFVLALPGIFIGYKLGGFLARLLDQRSDDPEEMRKLAADHDETALDQVTGVTGVYLKVLKLALKAPTLVLVGALGVLVGSYMVYGALGKGVEFFPEVEPELAIVNIHARGNMSVNERDSLVNEVEREILAIQRERGEFETIYVTSGNLETRDEDAEDTIGKIQLEFADWDKRRPASEIQDEIRDRTAHLSGIWVEFRKEEAGPPVGKPVHVQLSSRHPELLDPLVEKIRNHLEGMEGLKDVEDSRPIPGIQWELQVDRAQAAKYGADITSIGNVIKLVTNGMKVSDYRPNDTDDEVDITARYPERYRTIDQLDRIRINTESGAVPVSNFVERTAKQKTGLIRRTDAKRIAFIRADVETGVLPDTKVTEIRAWIDTLDIPDSVSVVFKGEDEEQAAAQAFLMKAFAIALFIMAVILVTQFNSFSSAMMILFAVIMSTAGVLLGLLVIDQPFGIVMSGVGVIALAGIVVNNNIVLIDTYDRLAKTESSAMSAILLTGAQRLRPVMLTTITTILGLLPMVMQTNIDFVTRQISVGAPSTQWWVQLSTAIVFGLGFATILTLVVTPCALMSRAKFRAWRERRQGGVDENGPEEMIAPEGTVPVSAD